MKRIGGKVIENFTMTEKMVREAKKPLKGSCYGSIGSIPPPPDMSRPENIFEKPNEYFFWLTWDVWYPMVLLLKKELKKRCPEKLHENNGAELFRLSFEDGILKFFILKPWAAKCLELPEVYTFQKIWPFDVYREIIIKFPCHKASH